MQYLLTFALLLCSFSYAYEDTTIQTPYGKIQLRYDISGSIKTHIYFQDIEQFAIDYDNWYLYNEDSIILKDSAIYLLGSASGTSCPLELRVLHVKEKSIHLSKPFGNCADAVSIIQQEKSIDFLFPCFCDSNCHSYYATTYCEYKLDNTLTCKGIEYCGRTTCNEEKTDVFFDIKDDKVVELRCE